MTISDVIEAFGGNTAMARIFGVTPAAVSNWKNFGRFPDRLHYRISREAEARQIEIPATMFENGVSAA